ncbi:hypothetical protein Turpa_0380 [Turneriella parva DSM 21527]|uniref:Uncharacterized protein n=2 Tax=Turneriella TaxID=338321 RepID=I4B179_TURPD|nr:hypothetical protein Turpa_0380 [Turneriella parva DSM 21527]
MLFACIALANCLSMDKKIFEPGCAEPRKKPEEITVGYAVPVSKHRYLGEITIQYGSGYERPEILRRLRLEAAACGADGMLLGSFSRVDSKWKWADKAANDSFDTSGFRLIVTLYRFDDDQR